MTEPKWIDKRALILLHSQSVAEHGGLEGIRDEGLLDSALGWPVNKFHYEGEGGIAKLAASYGYGLAKNHPFADGNKRAAFLYIGLFLAVNGHRLKADKVDAIQTILGLAAGDVSEEKLAEWIEKNMVKK